MSEAQFYITVGGVLWSVFGGGYPSENHFVSAQPLEMHAGWTETHLVSPSGRLIFVCDTCNRASVTPDKHCPIGKIVSLTDLLVVDPIHYGLEER
jgi:hypothetical protein